MVQVVVALAGTTLSAMLGRGSRRLPWSSCLDTLDSLPTVSLT